MASLTLKTIFQAVDRMSGPTKTMTKNMERFGRAGQLAGKIGGGLLRAGAALATGAIVAGAAVSKAATAFADRGDAIAKNARMLGLTAEAYQELQYAAGIQGVTTEQLTQGMKLLNNQLGQLQTGTGSLYTALSDVNPALAKQLRGVKSTDEAFTILMDTLSKETNIQKRAMIAQAAFGKSGQELIKFANGGTDAISKLREEAHKYGLIIDQATAESAEAFNDSLSRLKQSALGLANQGLGRLVEKLQPLLQRFADWIAANKEVLALRVDQVFSTLERIAGALAPIFKSLAPALEPLWNLIMALSPALEGVAKVAAFIIEPIAKLVGGIAQSIASITGGDVKASSIREQADSSGLMAEMGLSPVSPNTGMIAATSSSSVSRSIVDLNIPSPPPGTSATQRGDAPGFTLNLGQQMGGAR